MKDIKKSLISHRNSIVLLVSGFILLTISNVFYLPFAITAIIDNAPLSGYEYLLSLGFYLLGLVLIIVGLYFYNKRNTRSALSYIGHLALVGLCVIVGMILVAMMLGFIAEFIYDNMDSSFDQVKIVIDLISRAVYCLISPITQWLIASVVFTNSFKIGVRKSIKSIKSNYLGLLIMNIISTVLVYISVLGGNQLSGLIIQSIVAIITSIVLLLTSLYLYEKVVV